jgi:hypothetical protein
MGDRAVYGFKSEGHILFLYSHEGGEGQLATMQAAIEKARPRWSRDGWVDASYATRIAISHIIGPMWAQETGYGLSIDAFSAPDYPYAYVVDWDARTVEQIDTWDEREDRHVGPVMSFDVFLAHVTEDA